MEKIKIGNSDYKREEMEQGVYGWGTSNAHFLKTIRAYEAEGYTVKFETNLFRRIFALGIYKVTAYR